MNKKIIIALACVAAVISGVIYYLSPRDNPARQAAQFEEAITKTSEGNSLIPSAEDGLTKSSSGEKGQNQEISVSEPTTTQTVSATKLKISGRVLFEEGGAASGAAVQLFTYGVPTMQSVYIPKDTLIASTTADTEGRFSLEVDDNPLLRIAASLKGRAAKSEMLVNNDYFISRNQNTPKTREVSKDLILPKAVELSGKVMSENDLPVAGTIVKAILKADSNNDMSFTQSETLSREDGSFIFDDIAKGIFIVKASKPGFTEIDVETSAPAKNLVLRLASNGASLAGFVFMKSTGQGVAGAKITLVRENKRMFWVKPHIDVVSDEKGAYRIENIPEGEYSITATKDNLSLWRNNLPDNGRLLFAAKENKQGYDIFLFPGYTIRGTVTTKESKEPIDGVEIIPAMNIKVAIRGVSGADGKYEINNVPQGVWMLKAQRKGFFMVSAMHGWDGVHVNVQGDSMVVVQDFEMNKAVSISGIVKETSGAPVADAKVIVVTQSNMYQLISRQGSDGGSPVNEKGEFTVECASNQTVRIRASASRFPDSTSENINVKDQPVTGIEIVMKAGAGISGRVVDPDGKPAPQASVRIFDQIIIGDSGALGYNKVLTTDVNGHFIATDVPSGSIRILATSKGFSSSEDQTLELASGEMKTDVVLKLRTAHYIAGKVTNADGKPFPNTQVFASSHIGSSHGSASTGEDGSYRIEGLTEDKHYVHANSNEGSEQKENVSVDRDDVNFVIGKNPVTLIGIVLDGKTREPLKDFSVISKSSDISPEKNPEKAGVFSAKKLKRGYSYSIIIEAPGCMTLDKNVLVPHQMEDNIIEMTFEMGGGCSIEGRVVEKETHNPIAGAQFAIVGKGNEFWQLNRTNPIASARTGEDGHFRLENIEPGPIIVSIIPPEPYMLFDRRLVLNHGESLDLGDVEVSGGSILRGRVLQIPGDSPMADVTVEARDNYGKISLNPVKTNQAGEYMFKGLSNGWYSITLPDYKISQGIDIVANSEQTLDLRVGSGSLSGLVLRGGKPVKCHVGIRLPNVLGWTKSTQSNDDGSYSIKDLRPGRWMASIYTGNYSSFHEESVDIIANGETKKDFNLPILRISGTVLNSSGDLVEDALVTAQWTRAANSDDAYQPRTWTARTESNGAFVFEELSTGEYSVSASKAQVGRSDLQTVNISDESSPPPLQIRLETSGGTLISTALNTEKQPLAEAWCYLTKSDGTRFNHGQARNPDGVMRIENIPAGIYQVQVSSFGFSVNEHTVEIKEGQDVELVDELYHAGALRWALIDEQGRAIVNAACRLTPNDPNSPEKAREGTTDANGLWIVRGLYPGAYTVVSRLSDGREFTKVIKIEAHQLVQEENVVK